MFWSLILAEHIYTYINPSSERDLTKACKVLNEDGIIAYPTDVNWAIGCHCSSPKALNRLRSLKPAHPKDQPFSLICHSFSMISEVGILDQAAYRILKKILPGPYTILLKRNRNLPKQIKDKRLIVGVRFPDAPLLTDLVKMLGQPLVTTSLPESEPSKGPIRFGYQVEEIFGHALDLILDLGNEVPTLETTILDCTEGVQLVREGAGDISLLKEVM